MWRSSSGSVRWGSTAPLPVSWASTTCRTSGGGIELFDGVAFNADDPIGYLNSLSIHQDFSVAEIAIGVPRALAG